MATPPSTAPVMPDGLAVPPLGVVRSRVKMDAVTNTEARLQRAKERLYVLCQAGGWGFFAALQAFYTELAGPKYRSGLDQMTAHAVNVFVVLLALLLTHFARRLIHRWGWKEMHWGRLVPRIIGLAFALSAVWSAVGFGVLYLLIGLPWKSPFSLTFTIGASVVNGTILLVGWFCLYFIYHVYDRVQRLQVEQLRLAATVKEAELRALKSQVNPHFLFNSLNSLRALIDEDAPRAREAVTRLANMLRYSLQSGQQELVPFDDEIRIVEDYLALEQIRHESRLRVRWEITPEARGLHVPPMLLQTLVENAVKYGISTRRDGGELVISAHRVASELNIRVTNPGDLAAPTSAAAARAGSSTGVGLRNASERLKLLFGERATLILRPEPAGCVTADVSIPLTAAAR